MATEPAEPTGDMADLDFFWDPVCPWAWITSRWVHEVRAQNGIDVDWRFISLKVVNEEKGYAPELVERYTKTHGLGYRLLSVAAAVRAEHGSGSIGDLYTAFGTRIHVERDAPSLRDRDGVAAVLDSLGIDRALADAADGDAFDDVVRADTALALERAGTDLGTPVLTFAPPDGPSFFGPVVSRIPHGDEALRLWDLVGGLARFPGFAELKRSIRNTPQVS